MATRKITRTTAPARSTCRCPLCAGSTLEADGVYHCRAGETVEYLVFVAGEFLAARSTYLAAETELNAARRDALTRAVELAAAEADLDAEAEEFTGAPAEEFTVWSQYISDAGESHEPQLVDDGLTLIEALTLCNDRIAHCTNEGMRGFNERGRTYWVAAMGAPEDNWREDEINREEYEAWEREQSNDAGAPIEILPFTPDDSPTLPSAAALPPAIVYSMVGRGFTWTGADRYYPTYTEAAEARDHQSNPPVTRVYPRTGREVRDQLASRGLLAA